MMGSLSETLNLTLCGAPANAMSDAFDLCRSLVGSDAIGKPRLVYAEMEDGPVFRSD